MDDRIKSVVIIWSVLILTSIPGSVPDVSGEANLERVYHEPENVTSNDKVTIYLVVKATENISEVRYFYCEKEPAGSCSVETEMTDKGNNTYIGTIRKFHGGTKVGYNITIEYENGTEEYPAPEPDGYFFYRVQEDEEEDSSFLGIPMTLGSLGLAIALSVIKNRRRS